MGSEIDTTRQAEPRREKPERETAAPAVPQQEPAKKRGMFAGLKLDAGRAPAKSHEARETFAGEKLPASERPAPAKESERDRLLKATEGYAKALSDAARMGGLGLPIVEHQKQALEKAGAALDAIRPESTRELQSALRHDPQTLRAMNELQGPERAARLVAGMERERQAQLDPNVRAERLAAQWNGLETRALQASRLGSEGSPREGRGADALRRGRDRQRQASGIGAAREAERLWDRGAFQPWPRIARKRRSASA